MLPDVDWITKIVTVGPPVLLVIGLLIILQAAARNVIDIRKTALLSGIVAVFFGLWILALPELRTRRVAIVTTVNPKDFLDSYSLRPIKYRIESADAKDSDLDDYDFDFPNNTDTLRLHFNLAGLIQSYEDNLRTVLRVSQADPKCFQEATQGVSYSKVAGNIQKLCPGTVKLVNSQL